MEYAIQSGLSGVVVDNNSYRWQDGILLNGIDLAHQVDSVAAYRKATGIVLIGHSQGGLVSRIAVAALVDPKGLELGIRREVYPSTLRRAALHHLAGLAGTSAALIRAIVMVA